MKAGIVVACGGLILGGVLTWRVCLLVDAGTKLLSDTDAAIAMLPAKYEALHRDATEQLTAIRAESAYQLDALRVPLLKLADDRSKEALRIVDARVGQSLEIVDARSGQALKTVEGLRADLAPTLANTAALVKDLQNTSDALYPDIQAAVESTTVAATQTAQAAQSVQQAVPGVLKGVETLEANSNATTASTAEMMKNLAAATKPLPTWLRIPLSITGALAPTVAGAVSAAAAAGAFH